MSDVLSPQDLRALIDYLARKGVSHLCVKQGEEQIEITIPQLDRPVSQPAHPNVPEEVCLAGGPGVFHPRHPAGDGMSRPCLQAGDFLFPLADPLCTGDEILTPEGTVVDYGTPLWRHPKHGTSA